MCVLRDIGQLASRGWQAPEVHGTQLGEMTMELKEFKNVVRENGGDVCRGLSKWIGALSHPTIGDKSDGEIAADSKHLLVWHRRSPGAELYELSARELHILRDVLGVETGNCVATAHGIRLA